MSDNKDVDNWAQRSDLTSNTVELLRENGFTSLRLLRHLTPDLLTTNFQTRLPLAQYAALRAALKDLGGESSTVQQSERRESAPSDEEEEGGQESFFHGLKELVNDIKAQKSGAGATSVEQPETRVAGKEQVQRLVQQEKSAGLKPSSSPTALETSDPRDENDDCEDVPEPSCKLSTSSLSLGDDIDTTEDWQNSYYFDPSSSKTLRFFLMGKTGGGKSATGNTILGEQLFDAEICFSSVTSRCSFHARKRNGITLEITDSPGLCDTKTPEEDIAGKVVQAVVCMHPGPTAFLYVIGIGRYTEEDQGVYERIKRLFDDRITGYIIIIFTHGDQLKQKKKTIQDVLHTAPDSLLMALGECGHRYVVFDNMSDDKQPQINSLLNLIRKMSKDNGWEPYKCPKYDKVSEKMNQEVARRLRKVQEEEMKRKKYVQELEEKTKLAVEKAEQEKKAFERKEAEREERMKKAEEERQEKMAALQKMINEQKLSAEKEKEEKRKLQQEQEQMMKKLEKERKDELERIEKQMKEKEQLRKDKEAAVKAENEARRHLIEVKEKEEQKIKSKVAESESSCIIL